MFDNGNKVSFTPTPKLLGLPSVSNIKEGFLSITREVIHMYIIIDSKVKQLIYK